MDRIGRARSGRRSGPLSIERGCHEHDSRIDELLRASRPRQAGLGGDNDRLCDGVAPPARSKHSRRRRRLPTRWSLQPAPATARPSRPCLVRARPRSSRRATPWRTRTRARFSSPPMTPSTASQTDGGKPATLLIGQDDYPFPIPLVAEGRLLAVRHRGGPRGNPRPAHRPQRARRDPGLPRLLRRAERIRRHHAQGRRHGGYAQRIVSSPGKKDGLYWPAAAGEAAEPDRRSGRRCDPARLSRSAAASRSTATTTRS